MTRRSWQVSWWLLLAASQCGGSRPAWAEDPPAPVPGATCDAADPKKCSIPLQAGQVAPYAGQLLTPRLAVDLGQKAQGCDARLELAVKFSQDSTGVDLQLEKSLRENDARAAAEREKILRDALDEARARPWYEHPAFVAVTAVVVTIGLVVVVGYALQGSGRLGQDSSPLEGTHPSSISPPAQGALLRF